MVPALELQERTSSEHCIRYIQTETENHLEKVIFLTWDELNKLKDYHIPHDKQYLERVRDVFLFCCFTSLRYSDVRNLKRSDIKPDHIEVTTVKTADSLIIELNDHSKAILENTRMFISRITWHCPSSAIRR